MKKFKFYQFVLALVAAVLMSAGASQINTASAAPVASAHNLQGVVGEQTTDVQWHHRRHRGRYVGPAIALGIFGAAAAAAAAQNQQYYYSQPRQKCWVQTGPYQGQGYWAWC
ncbi:MAG: hypothetical protein KF835_11095 [Xanthobacteraceae bacterium]|nr:hypothetical protein [Xanthobacteraceae bacterium]